MSIALRAFDPEEYRERIRTFPDKQLIEEGKKMRWLSGDGKIVSLRPSAIAEQLKICREEYRQR